LGTSPKNEVSETTEAMEEESVVPAITTTQTLTAEQLKDIDKIHATFTEVYPISLIETTKNFEQNKDSGREIEVWLKMVDTYKRLTKSNKYPRLEQRQEVFSVILASTMMPLATIKDKVEFNELNNREIDDIYTQFISSFSP